MRGHRSSIDAYNLKLEIVKLKQEHKIDTRGITPCIRVDRHPSMEPRLQPGGHRLGLCERSGLSELIKREWGPPFRLFTEPVPGSNERPDVVAGWCTTDGGQRSSDKLAKLAPAYVVQCLSERVHGLEMQCLARKARCGRRKKELEKDSS